MGYLILKTENGFFFSELDTHVFNLILTDSSDIHTTIIVQIILIRFYCGHMVRYRYQILAKLANLHLRAPENPKEHAHSGALHGLYFSPDSTQVWTSYMYRQ